jgi:hypothetical protein
VFGQARRHGRRGNGEGEIHAGVERDIERFADMRRVEGGMTN